MATPQKRKRILFVEDHEETWEMVVYILTGYEIICARNFDEALRLAGRQGFDLFILDNWLPDRSGVELCRAIREFDQHTPILFYSAAGYKRDIEEGFSAGAQGYLVKPVSLGELKQAVAKLISPA